jgi:hypothetical protein
VNVDRVTLQILGDRDDLEELDLLTGRLRSELLDLDVESVARVDVTDPPADAKGVATLAGVLIVKLGGQALGRSPFMPPWGAELTEEQMRDLVAYVRALNLREQAMP